MFFFTLLSCLWHILCKYSHSLYIFRLIYVLLIEIFIQEIYKLDTLVLKEDTGKKIHGLYSVLH